jgi:hypothetical protein
MVSSISNHSDLASHAGCVCHGPEVQSLSRRIGADFSRRGFVAGMGVSVASLGLLKFANAQSATSQPPRPTLFTNFGLFDGKSGTLRRSPCAR